MGGEDGQFAGVDVEGGGRSSDEEEADADNVDVAEGGGGVTRGEEARSVAFVAVLSVSAVPDCPVILAFAEPLVLTIRAEACESCALLKGVCVARRRAADGNEGEMAHLSSEVEVERVVNKLSTSAALMAVRRVCPVAT